MFYILFVHLLSMCTVNPSMETPITWDQSSETWLQFSIRYCGRLCRNKTVYDWNSETCRNPQCFECDCDASCSIYGTCCPTFRTNSSNGVTGQEIFFYEDSENVHTKNLPSPERFVCDTFPGLKKNIYMVKDCFPDYVSSLHKQNSHESSRTKTLDTRVERNKNVHELCLTSSLDTLDVLTPYLDLRYGITFKNKYCAICNGYNIAANSSELFLNISENVENVAAPWILEAKCSHFQNVYTVTSEIDLFKLALRKGKKECSIEYRQPNAHLRAKECDPNMNKAATFTCSSSDLQLQDYCHNLTYKFLRVRGGHNIFCEICNNGPLYEQMCLINIVELTLRPEVYVPNRLPPFSLLFGAANIGSDFHTNNDQMSNSCTRDDGDCPPPECSAGKLIDLIENCKSPLSQIKGLGYKLSMVLVPTSLNICVLQSDVRLIGDRIYGILFNISREILLERYVTLTLLPHGSGEHELLKKVSLTVHLIGDRDERRDSFEEKVLRLISDKWIIDLYHYSTFEITFKTTVLGEELTSLVDDIPDLKIYEDISVQDKPYEQSAQLQEISCTSKNDAPTKVQRYRAIKSLKQDFSDIWKLKDKFIDVTHSLSCLFVRVNYTDLWINDSVVVVSFMFQNKNITITSESKISLVGGELRVCVDLFHNLTRNPSDTKEDLLLAAIYYLEFTCVFLSVIFLSISFLTYCLFPTLRTLPGLNNMSLCICLAIAQSSLLITAQVELASKLPQGYCLFHAGILHYSWLASFMWMSACCIHMYRVFTSRDTQFLDTRSNMKRYLRYCLYAFGSPIIVIVLLVVVTSVSSSGESNGYSSSLCFLDIKTSVLTVLLSLVGPLCITILINAVLFALTVREMMHVSSLQENRSNGQSVITYAKLSTLTGVFYIIGGVALHLKNPVLQLLTSPVMCLQGVFIFTSFTFNKRVGKLYNELWRSLTKSFHSDTRNKRAVYSLDTSSGPNNAAPTTDSTSV